MRRFTIPFFIVTSGLVAVAGIAALSPQGVRRPVETSALRMKAQQTTMETQDADWKTKAEMLVYGIRRPPKPNR